MRMPRNGEFRQFSMLYSIHSDIGVIRVENFPVLKKAMDQGFDSLDFRLQRLYSSNAQGAMRDE